MADLTIHIDGASRGNPGPAAYAFVIARDGQTAVEEKGCLGATTNNVAEYTALVRALERAAALGGGRVLVNSDSELLVKQMNGEYRVRNEDLRSLFDRAKELCRGFEQVTLRHVFREQNKRADELCNKALDGDKPAAVPGASQRGSSRGKSGSKTKKKKAPDQVRAEAIECLSAAALAWSRGNARQPTPDLVWDQLWSVLEENGLV